MALAFSHRHGAWLGGLVLIAASAGVAAQSTLTPEQLTIRVQRMSDSSARTEAAVNDMQAQMQKLSDEVAKMGRLIDNRAMLDMIQQVDNLADEISQLRGEIEQQSFEIGEVKKRQRELYLDVDRRLRDLESGAAAAAPAPSIGATQPATSTAGSSTPSTAPQAAAGSTESAAQGAAQTTTASLAPASTATQSEEREAYQAAFDTLKEGRYKKAKTELKTFLARYPGSSFAGNAQYWLGEAHYVTRDFDQGVTEFRKVLNQYPTSNKVPDAMLKLGYTHYELKQFAEAKAVLQELREKFPKATAARLATKRLDRIRKEGH